MEKNTLNQFGHGFQVKVLSALITDRTFTSQVFDIIDKGYFDNKALQWLLGGILDYYSEYKILPTLDVFKVQVSNLEDGSTFRTEVLTSLKEVWKNIDSDDLQFVKKQTTEFCQNQEIRKAIEDSIDLLKVGNYDAIKVKIDNALKKGVSEDLGSNYLLDVDKRYTEKEQKRKVPTGWQVVDDLMGGGLPVGAFGLIMGDKGSGKCIGPATEIEIEYEEIGIELFNEDKTFKSIMWIKPWQEFDIDGVILFGWQIELILNNNEV